jgi:hypothetical protein
MLKAMREAKVFTSWLNPSAAHEHAMRRFVETVLSPDNEAFRTSFLQLHRDVARYGIYNSLAQLAINFKQVILGLLQQNKPLRAELHDLPADFRPDAPPRARHQHNLAGEKSLKLRRIEVDGFASEQLRNFHRGAMDARAGGKRRANPLRKCANRGCNSASDHHLRYRLTRPYWLKTFSDVGRLGAHASACMFAIEGTCRLKSAR